jgi:hypothetical protein
MPHFHSTGLHLMGVAVLLPLLVACSKEDVNSLVEKTKQTVSDTAAKTTETVKDKIDDATAVAKEKLQLSGKCELQCGGPVATPACFARLITFEDGRPSVLQLQSYRDFSEESFPSVYVHAQVTASQPSELNGISVSAQAFVQSQAQGAIWYTDPDNPVQIKVNSVIDGLVNVEFVSGKLLNSNDATTQTVSGRIEGVLQ